MSSEEINCPGGPPSSSGLMPYVLPYVKMINDLNATVVRMQNEIDRLKQNLEESSNHCLPKTPVATSSSSSMVDLSDVFLSSSVHQEIKSKRHEAPLKHANPNSIEPNQVAPQMVKRTRYQSVSTEKMLEVNTNSSHKCLGCNDHKEKHTPRANKKRKMDVLSITPLASKSSSSLVDLSSAQVPVHQEIESKGQVRLKQPNPDLLLESNQTKSQMTWINPSKSVSMKRKSESITSDNVNLKGTGNFNLEEKQNKKKKTENQPKNLNKKQKFDKISNHNLPKIATKEINVEPILQVASSSMVEVVSKMLNVFAELPAQQDIKIRRRGASCKQHNPDLLESNQSKLQITRRTRSKSVGAEKMLEANTSNIVSDQCLRSYDPKEKHINIAKPGPLIFEVPAQEADIKLRKRGASRKQPNPDLLGSNQSKPQIPRRTRSKSVGAEKMLEANTSNNVSDQCLRNYNPKEKHIPIAKPGSLIFEVPAQEADIKLRKRGASRKQPNPDSLGSNQSKPQITRRTRSKSVDAEKMLEANTSNNVSDQCLRSYNSKEKHISIAKSVSVTSDNLYFKGSENDSLEEKKNKRKMITKELKNLKEKQKLNDMSNLHVPEITSRELNVLQFTSMDSASSSSMIDSSSAEILSPKKNDDKSNRHQIPLKHANLDSLESNHITPQMTRRNQSQSESISEVIRSDTVSDKSIRIYDPKEKHIPSSKPVSLDIIVKKVPKNIQSLDIGSKDLEVPNFTFKKLLPLYSVEGTENMSNDVYIRRHLKMEHLEIQRKRWDMQRIRELNRIAHLKRRSNKCQSPNSDKDELITSLNDAENNVVIQVID